MGDEQLNQLNQTLRANPKYRELLVSMGVNPDGPVVLNDHQRKQAEQWVRQNVGDIGGMEIDPAGNINQNEGFGKQAKKWGPIAGAAALTAFGIPGTAFSGLLGGTGGAMTAGQMASFGAPFTAANSAASLGLAGGTAATGGFAGLATALKNPAVIGGIGRAIGAGGDTAAQNRGNELQADETAAGINLARENQFRNATTQYNQDDRAATTDALRKVQQGSYLSSGTKDYVPREGLPSYGFGPRAATPDEVAAGTAASTAARSRLEGGNPVAAPSAPIPFTSTARRPGAFERTANILAPGLSIWEAIRRAGG